MEVFEKVGLADCRINLKLVKSVCISNNYYRKYPYSSSMNAAVIN